MRREAVLSSRIEGTQASLSDLFYFEAAQSAAPPVPDVVEVFNYVRALEFGLERQKKLPISLRLVRELHERLMRGVRGQEQTPGEFRKSQNWIGPPGCALRDATFVPPPPKEMIAALDAFEKFLHVPTALPPLVRLALVHYQFEAIHPFRDGNGRIGRLLITLLLCVEGILPLPLLYLSAFFERHRDEYYRRLLAVSQRADWDGWITFFLNGVNQQATDAILRANRLFDLRNRYHKKVHSARSSSLLLKLVDSLFESPYTTATQAQKLLGVTWRAAQNNVDKLVKFGILREVTGRSYGRVYRAAAIEEIVDAASAEGSRGANRETDLVTRE